MIVFFLLLAQVSSVKGDGTSNGLNTWCVIATFLPQMNWILGEPASGIYISHASASTPIAPLIFEFYVKYGHSSACTEVSILLTFLHQSVLCFYLPGQLWELHAWTDEGEYPT